MTSAVEKDIEHIKDSLARIEARCARIEEQAMKTNGRVTGLEKWRYGLLIGLGTLAATKWPVIDLLLQTTMN